MSFDASNFIKNRISKTAVIESRIKKILYYIIDCYNKILADGKTYDYSNIGKVSKENFLRNGLVDDYLRRHLKLLNSGSEEYTIISKESTETYTASYDGLLHDDPIDIHIVDKALQDAWKTGSYIYYAIECKRISQLSDSSAYINDIKKFTERDYKETRLPYEGQIAFLETGSITHHIARTDINQKLATHPTIVTERPLEPVVLHPLFDGSYTSTHSKVTGKKQPFSIHHLIFDYSSLIVR